MKKIVFLLLILLVLNDFALGAAGIKEEWAKVKAAFNKAKTWLKDKGLWDPLVNLVKDGALALAKRKCREKYDDPTLCNDVVQWLYDHVGSL